MSLFSPFIQVFFDLYNESTADYKMEIDKHKPPLGSGSFGFVLEAKWGRVSNAFIISLERGARINFALTSFMCLHL